MFSIILTYLWSSFVCELYCGFVQTLPERKVLVTKLNS